MSVEPGKMLVVGEDGDYLGYKYHSKHKQQQNSKMEKEHLKKKGYKVRVVQWKHPGTGTLWFVVYKVEVK